MDIFELEEGLKIEGSQILVTGKLLPSEILSQIASLLPSRYLLIQDAQVISNLDRVRNSMLRRKQEKRLMKMRLMESQMSGSTSSTSTTSLSSGGSIRR